MRERYVYLFFRTDLPLAQQIVQSNHATLMMASLRGEEGTPNIVAIGVPNIRALERVLDKLRTNQIPHFAWTEPDFDYGLTAIASAPIWGEQRDILKNYRIYSPGTEMGKNSNSACLFTEDGRAKSEAKGGTI